MSVIFVLCVVAFLANNATVCVKDRTMRVSDLRVGSRWNSIVSSLSLLHGLISG